jgi:hypothetical protein
MPGVDGRFAGHSRKGRSMMIRFVVPAEAAALALMITPVLAAAAAPTAAAQKQCAQLESAIDAQLPEARQTQVAKATKERQEGEQLCNSGKTDQGIATLEHALRDAMYRG